MGGHSLFQGIFLTQESNPGLPHCWQILYHLSLQGRVLVWSQGCTVITSINCRTLSTPSKKILPLFAVSCPLSSFPPPGLDNHQAYFVSMNLPVWTLHINGIIQYVVLYDCTRQYFAPFHCQVIFHCRDRSYFIYLVVSCKTFRACLIFIKSFSVEKFFKNFY